MFDILLVSIGIYIVYRVLPPILKWFHIIHDWDATMKGGNVYLECKKCGKKEGNY